MVTEIEQNRKVVDNFFVALETQHFEMLKDVFAANGRQLKPIHLKVFPKALMGQRPYTNNIAALQPTLEK